LFHQRICGLLATRFFSIGRSRLSSRQIEAAYHRADDAIQKLIHLLAAA
jgi:hypothetical protein